MKNRLSILSILLFIISLTSHNHAQEINPLATEVLVPSYDNKFLVGVKYNDNVQRFKIKSVYDKGGKKLEGMFAGFVNPIAAECQDLKKLSVATDKRTVWNLEQDLLENSESKNIIILTNSGDTIQCGSSYSEIPISGLLGYNDEEINQVFVRFYLVEGTLKTYIVMKENENLQVEVAILTLEGKKLVLREGDKQREITDYETQSGEKHYVKAIRGSDGILKVMSNYFGDFQFIPYQGENGFSLDEFMRSK